jgi:hypothetical protein
MASTLELLLEAEKRGIQIPPQKKALLDEARSRGLLTNSGLKHGAQPQQSGTAPDPNTAPKMSDEAARVVGVDGQGSADFAQGLGVGTRAVMQGLGAGAGIVYDAAAGATNLLGRGVDAAYNELRSPDLSELITGKHDKSIWPYAKPLREYASDAADAIGLPEASTPVQKFAEPIVESAASVVPTMGAGFIARGAQSAPAMVRAAGDFFSAAPDVQIVSAAASGGGSEIAKEMGASPGVQTAAGIAAGLGAGVPYTVARDAVPATARLAQQLWQDIVTGTGAEKRAGEALLRLSSDPQALPGRLTDAVNAPPSSTGAQPTTGQAVADPGLLAAQNALQSTDPRAAGLMANRNAGNNTALQTTLDSLAPQGGGSTAVQRAVQQQFTQFQGATDQMIARATQRAQDAIRAIGPEITPEQAGRVIRQAVGEEYSAARATTRQAYQGIDPSGESQVPTQPLYEPAASAVNDRYGASTFGTPQDLNTIITRLRDTNHASLDQIDGIRKDLGDIAGDLNRSTSDRNIAQQIRGQIDNYLAQVGENGAPGSNLTPEQVTAMRTAREARTTQGETFERGAVGNVTKTKAYGEPAVPDSGVAAEFLFKGSGSPEAVQQFMTAVGNRPEAVQALQSYAASDIRNAATGLDGTIDPRKLRRWVQDHSAILEQFPELANRTNTAMRAQAMVDNLAGRQARAIDDVEKSALGYFLGDMNPDAAVAKILNSQSSQADLDRLLGVISHDPEAMGGLRRAVVDFLSGKSLNAGTDITGNNLMSQAKFGANLDRYGPLLERIFSPEHMQAMRQIQSDLDTQQLSTAAKALGSNTVQNLSAASLLSNVSKGIVPLDNPIVQNLMRPYSWLLKLPEQNIRDILTDAMLDPALALRLVQGVKPAGSASLSLALRQRASALGIGVADGVASEPRQITGPQGAAQIGTAVGSQSGFSSGGVVTRKASLTEFLKDGKAEVQHCADGGMVKGGRSQAMQQISAVDPSLAPAVNAVFDKSPVLARHRDDFAVVTGKPMGPGTHGQLESYPPEELYNPIPGKATTEVYNQDPAVLQNLIQGDMLHRLGAIDFQSGQPVDRDWRVMKSSLLNSMTPEQDAQNRAVYDWYKAKGDPRSFRQFMDTSRGDEYIMGSLTPDKGDYWRGRPGTHQPSMYTPQQEEILNQMRAYLTRQPVQHFAKGGVVLNAEGAIAAKESAANLTFSGTGHRESPVKATHADHVAAAGKLVDQKASPDQKNAGNYQKAHLTWNGLSISIETPKGGTRSAKDGSWKVKNYPVHYGYIKRTMGADNDHVDVFIGDHLDSKRVWIIDQVHADTGKFDEHKCMIGFPTPKAARDSYVSSYSDGKGPQRIGCMTMMSVDQFKNWLKRGKRTKPVGRLSPPRSPAKAA